MGIEPDAEVRLSPAEVRRLVARQHPSFAGSVTRGAHGWDNDVFRLGSHHAVRLPRRASAVALIRNEQRWLPTLAAQLPIAVPAPVALGEPDEVFGWPWSIVPWIEGAPGAETSAAERDNAAEQLAAFFTALHVPAPSDAPRNPVRGVPMRDRNAINQERLAAWPDLLKIWDAGVAAPEWSGPAVWVHGDVHPANLLFAEGTLAAVIDFGDLTAGDPACDLAAAWLVLQAPGRERLRSALAERYEEATWVRARGWAAALAGLMMRSAIPSAARMARLAADEVRSG